MAFDVTDFVLRAGLGLEAEDRLLLGSHLVHGTHGGLWRLINERYFQFIVWRALAPKYAVKVETEGRADLVLTEGESKYVFEMKRWFSANGERELPSINLDIDKLRKSDAAIKGMIVFAAGARSTSVEHCSWLEEQLPRLRADQRHMHVFNTLDDKGQPKEFWLALWLV